MADNQTFVIVGGGLTGAKAAETLRERGLRRPRRGRRGGGPLPYERPPLSKSYLAGESPFSDAVVHDEAFYADHDVELLRGTSATALDPGARRVTLDGGSQLGYDQAADRHRRGAEAAADRRRRRRRRADAPLGRGRRRDQGRRRGRRPPGDRRRGLDRLRGRGVGARARRRGDRRRAGCRAAGGRARPRLGRVLRRPPPRARGRAADWAPASSGSPATASSWPAAARSRPTRS